MQFCVGYALGYVHGRMDSDGLLGSKLTQARGCGTQDVESALEQFEESMAVDFYFAGSRHAKFAAVRHRVGCTSLGMASPDAHLVQHLIEATADFNIHEYMDHVWNFDNVEPFTPMQLSYVPPRPRIAVLRPLSVGGSVTIDAWQAARAPRAANIGGSSAGR